MFEPDADRDGGDHESERRDLPGLQDDQDDYNRHLAAEMLASMPPRRADKRQVLRYLQEYLNIELQPLTTDELQEK